ncbi:hypothetical protein [Cognatilysobacter lacus]|uniref:Uncharacterized protein n=1 Tax=Cognatilysobacter lacus TaxID=1643323 RepID=A0A5D8Z112_9GAMM|nr:hypothetical protein [Lysobacter lacus]TZF88347.1 hypothetical protein FW784_10065 [Lysobacter lacus]
MEHYKNLTAQQLAIAAGCAMLVGSMTLPRSTLIGVSVLVLALVLAIGAYRKDRASKRPG